MQKLADILIIDFCNRRLVKKVKLAKRGICYLDRWLALVKDVGIRNIDPAEYPQEARRTRIPYCGMLDRHF